METATRLWIKFRSIYNGVSNYEVFDRETRETSRVSVTETEVLPYIHGDPLPEHVRAAVIALHNINSTHPIATRS